MQTIAVRTDAIPAGALPALEEFFRDLRPNGFAFPAEEPGALDVMMLYEDMTCGLRAKNTFDRVSRRLGLNARFKIRLWQFELMRTPVFRERAAQEAAKADIVMLSIHSGGQLPKDVQLFLEDWLDRKNDHACALVTLLDGVETDLEAKAAIPYLRGVAQRGGLDFFFEFCGQTEVASPSLLTGLNERAVNSSSTLDDILRLGRSYAHGGINE